MDACKRWRHAIIISVTLNIFLLCGVGILSAGIFTTEPVEELIELELVSEDSHQQSSMSSLEQANVSTKIPMQSSSAGAIPPNPSVASSSVAVQRVTSLSVDEVSNDFPTGTNTGASQDQSSLVNGGAMENNIASGGGGQSSNGGQGSSSAKTGGGIIGPKILSKIDPNYPESARQAGITGNVILGVQILDNGRAGDVSVKQSSGNDLLDESAVMAVYKWRFTPAKEKNTGRAVNCYTTIPIVFRLE